MTSVAKIAATIVAYHPNEEVFSKVIANTGPQVDGLLVVANDGGGWPGALPANATIAVQEKNLGLGAAYNVAAQWAREHGATHLLLLDQDSVPALGMVAILEDAFKQPGSLAAVGPLWRDTRSGDDGYFMRAAFWGVRKYKPSAGEIVPVEFLISSGSVISLDAWMDVGPFDEKLFIEHVDTDWTLRARAKGYRLYGVADARLDHAFGEATLGLLSLVLRRRLSLYPPERNYYLLRNSIALWRRPYVPWRWLIRDLPRTLALMLIYAVFIPPRRERLRAMLRATRDGLSMKCGMAACASVALKWP